MRCYRWLRVCSFWELCLGGLGGYFCFRLLLMWCLEVPVIVSFRLLFGGFIGYCLLWRPAVLSVFWLFVAIVVCVWRLFLVASLFTLFCCLLIWFCPLIFCRLCLMWFLDFWVGWIEILVGGILCFKGWFMFMCFGLRIVWVLVY